MRGTRFIAGLAMLAIVGAVLSYPVGAKASPQLTMATGAAVAPQINNGFIPGARRAIDGAKADKATADAKNKEANDLFNDEDNAHKQGLASLPDKVYSASDLIIAVQKDPKGAEGLAGAPVRAEGVVLKVDHKDGITTVFLGAPNANEKSPMFVFQIQGDKNFEVGKVAALEGKFVTKTKMEGFPNDIYVVTEHGLSAPAAANQQAAPKEPEAPFDGWKFVGSVEAEGNATGVFTKEGKTLYAHPGDKLSDDVVVVRMKAGEVVLRDGKKTSVVSPW